TASRLILAGCKCRKTLDSTPKARLRGVSSCLCRKMDVKTWVLVGSLRRSTCSLALAGKSVLSDCTSALTSVATRPRMPVVFPFLPFFPFELFSSAIFRLFSAAASGKSTNGPFHASSDSSQTHDGKYAPGSLKLLGCPLGH